MDTGKSYLGICKHFFYLYVTRGFGFVEYHDFELDKVSKEFVDSFLNWKEQQYFLNLLNPRKYYSLARNKYLTHIILDALEINNKATLYCYYNPELRKYDAIQFQSDPDGVKFINGNGSEQYHFRKDCDNTIEYFHY